MIHVLGSINIDYSCSVASLPGPGETIIGDNLFTTPGGKGANQAVAARRAGSSVKMTGAVGTDEIAEQALSCLAADDVDTSNVATVEGPTGCAFVFVDAHSENQIVIVPGANAQVSKSQLDNLSLSQADVLLLQLEVPVPIVVAAAKAAHRQGARVIANLAPYAQLANDLQLKSDTKDLAASLSQHLQTTVVLTLGADGVIAICEDEKIQIEGIAVDAIDTVGAGDTFAGFLGSRLDHGDSLSEALRVANRAAALACTKSGAQTAIPQYEAIDKLQ